MKEISIGYRVISTILMLLAILSFIIRNGDFDLNTVASLAYESYEYFRHSFSLLLESYFDLSLPDFNFDYLVFHSFIGGVTQTAYSIQGKSRQHTFGSANEVEWEFPPAPNISLWIFLLGPLSPLIAYSILIQHAKTRNRSYLEAFNQVLHESAKYDNDEIESDTSDTLREFTGVLLFLFMSILIIYFLAIYALLFLSIV